MDDLATAIRKAIERDGRTRYRLSKDTGLPLSTTYRFASGERNEISLSTASRFCAVLGLELRPVRRSRRAKA